MPQFKLRIDDDLHAAIKLSSEHNNRSVNSEIAHHLRNAMEAAGYLQEDLIGVPNLLEAQFIDPPAPEQTDVPVASAPRRVYKRKQKTALQTDIPDEVLQELVARLQEAWDKYNDTKDK
ncbi:Arc family DNA-binding protein [Aeromonas australiensis]|uniref:Arc family DNA-binding protein n=1 Tax=Aeromonas australiensis TaxID=1114880 RepID=UPI001F3242BD|nr:Arc family DNA-binding protein [Aeromonas australiensis]MCF3096558.1 Arc family DNA-binding protein [Aeromonas australiensis]